MSACSTPAAACPARCCPNTAQDTPTGCLRSWIGSKVRRLSSYDLFLADRCFDITRARRDLGYDPVVPARQGLAELVAGYRAEGLLVDGV